MMEIYYTSIPVSPNDWYAMGPDERLQLLRKHRADSNAIRYYEIKTGQRSVRTAVHRKVSASQVKTLRDTGLSFAKIAKQLGISASRASELSKVCVESKYRSSLLVQATLQACCDSHAHLQWIASLPRGERYYISELAGAIAA